MWQDQLHMSAERDEAECADSGSIHHPLVGFRNYSRRYKSEESLGKVFKDLEVNRDGIDVLFEEVVLTFSKSKYHLSIEFQM